jgi:hypothetical protein
MRFIGFIGVQKVLRVATRVMRVTVVLGLVLVAAAFQKTTDADRAAALIVRWQQIVYPAFENARASIDEENTDHLNAVLSQGGVRAVQDHVDAAGLKKIDAAAEKLAAALIKAAKPYPGGSSIIDAEVFDEALDAVCPLYPFCGR